MTWVMGNKINQFNCLKAGMQFVLIKRKLDLAATPEKCGKPKFSGLI